MGTANNQANSTADIVPLEEERARRAGEESAPALDTPGAMLRAARLEAGLSLAQVSAEINVKAERIEAIEEMRVADLPAAPYTLGFVRAYARLLTLPAEPLAARFREAAGYPGAGAAAAAAKMAPPPRDLSATRELSLVAVLAVVGFILWCAWKIVEAMAPEEAASLPEGSPISGRMTAPRVVYEVDGALGMATGRTAQKPQEDVAAIDPPMAPPARAPAAASPDREALVGSVSGSDSGSDPQGAEAEPAADAAPTEASLAPASEAAEGAAAEEGGPAPGSVADLLNRQALARASEIEAEIAAGREEAAPLPRSSASEAGREFEPEAGPAPLAPQPGTIGDPAAPPAVLGRAADASSRAAGAASAARLVQPVSPVYPSRCETGAAPVEVVTVQFGVSRFGKVVGPAVAQSSNSCFDASALAAVSRFSFEPARQEGRAVSSSGQTTRVVFRRQN